MDYCSLKVSLLTLEWVGRILCLSHPCGRGWAAALPSKSRESHLGIAARGMPLFGIPEGQGRCLSMGTSLLFVLLPNKPEEINSQIRAKSLFRARKAEPGYSCSQSYLQPNSALFSTLHTTELGEQQHNRLLIQFKIERSNRGARSQLGQAGSHGRAPLQGLFELSWARQAHTAVPLSRFCLISAVYFP